MTSRWEKRSRWGVHETVSVLAVVELPAVPTRSHTHLWFIPSRTKIELFHVQAESGDTTPLQWRKGCAPTVAAARRTRDGAAVSLSLHTPPPLLKKCDFDVAALVCGVKW
eukprot:m.488273 g.488273  ORF g.488273 m.488273 type:complete len:110 (-) comp87195_c0_seq1:80-409(-)